MKIEDDASNTVATFEYDALGRRIRKVDAAASRTTLYYYDADWRCLEERDGSDTLQRSFIYGNYIDEVLVMTVPGSPAADYYYLHDHLYSPAALLAANGTVVERYEYDAYGTVQVLTSGFSPLSSSQYDNPYTFTGRRLDALDNAGLKIMYYRYRVHDPYAGRFFQQDPLQSLAPTPFNAYPYTHNNPLVSLDGLGLFTIEAVGVPAYNKDENDCIHGFWMSVALRPTDAEVQALSAFYHPDTDGDAVAFAIMRKYATWRVYDCQTGIPLQYFKGGSKPDSALQKGGPETATFVRPLRVHKTPDGQYEIMAGGAAGGGGVSISTWNESSKSFTKAYVSPFYSAVISRGFGSLSACCTRGQITVVEQFFLYSGRPLLGNSTVRPGQVISAEEYRHHMYVYDGWLAPVQVIGPYPEMTRLVASGSLHVNIEWNCKQQITASAPELDLVGGNNTRTGREGDWNRAQAELKKTGDDRRYFPIPF